MTPHQNNRQLAPAFGIAAPCLEIDALTVLRGQRLVIDRLTHRQNHGELCLLTGANGTGKSTLLRSIAGRLPADSGNASASSDSAVGKKADKSSVSSALAMFG